MAQFLRPDSNGSSTVGWSGSYTDIDETTPNDSDSVGFVGSSGSREFGLNSADIPAAGDRTLRIRCTHDFSVGTLAWYLRDGTTVLQSGSITVPETYQTFNIAITEAISDYSNLNILFEVTGFIYISWVELEIPDNTPPEPEPPTVTTQAVTEITDTTATGNGNVTSDGNETITERGVCWSTSTAPTTADNTVTSAGTTGAFTAAITGLTAETLYYVRAYAINSEGTSYGEEVEFTSAPEAIEGWYNPLWQYRVSITVQASEIDADLTNFPVYVNLANLPAGFHTNVKADGGDIRITTDDGETEIARELVFYDNTEDEGELYFKAPVLSDTTDTIFYLYYGNAAASDYDVDDTYGAENVWTAFDTVHHLQQLPSGSAPQMLDSTANNFNGTSAGSMTSGDSVDGKLAGKALDFDGTDDSINLGQGSTGAIGDNLHCVGGNTFSVSVWFSRGGTVSSNRMLIGKGGGVGAAATFALYIANNELITVLKGTMTSAIVSSLTTGVFYKATLTWDGTTARVYFNGVFISNVTVGSASDQNRDFVIGATADGGNSPYNGVIDEVRVAPIALSAEWNAAEYINENTPLTFYEVGSQEEPGGEPEPATVNLSKSALLATLYSVSVLAGSSAEVTPAKSQLEIQAYTPTVEIVNDVSIGLTKQDLTLHAYSPTVKTGVAIDLDKETLLLTSFDVAVRTGATVEIDKSTLKINLKTVMVQTGATVATDKALLEITAKDVSIQSGVTIGLQKSDLALIAKDVSVQTAAEASVNLSKSNLIIQAYAPNVQAGAEISITPAKSVLSLTPYTAGVQVGISLQAEKSALTITAKSVTVQAGNQVALNLSKSALEITPYSALVKADINVQPEKAGLILVAYAPAVTIYKEAIVEASKSVLEIRAYTPGIDTGAVIDYEIIYATSKVTRTITAKSFSVNEIAGNSKLTGLLTHKSTIK